MNIGVWRIEDEVHGLTPSGIMREESAAEQTLLLGLLRRRSGKGTPKVEGGRCSWSRGNAHPFGLSSMFWGPGREQEEEYAQTLLQTTSMKQTAKARYSTFIHSTQLLLLACFAPLRSRRM